MEQAEESNTSLPIKFNKRRKVYRQRTDHEDEPSLSTPAPQDPILSPPESSSVPDESITTTDQSISEIIKARKQRKQRLNGVAFSATNSPQTSTSLLPPLPQDAAEHDISAPNRFAKRSGIIGDVNKHMMAYIDSELARQRQVKNPDPSSVETQTTSSNRDESTPQQAISLGKIQEIDLGDESRHRNASLMDEARRRAAGEDVQESRTKERTKSRLGPDGKPWRNRKRRASDDIKRDSIVDQVLRENKIDMYEELPTPPPRSIGNGENDDRIAEEFRREFMESQNQRRKVVPPPPSSVPTKPGEEVLKGPKLGGSRSMRAKMHAELLKVQVASSKK